MATILVVEDERDLQELLRYELEQQGHLVRLAASGAEAVRMARQSVPDLVLLDLMLPDLQGTDVCKTLRRDASTRAVPILMLTAKGEEIDRVVGFELGADDYVTKPFSVRELLLRVAALLRRARGEEPGEAGPVEFGRLRIDRGAHRAWVDGREVELTAIEMKLLVLLYDRRDRVQSRDSLLDQVWGDDTEITTRAVDTHVKRLRDKLGPAAVYVETVRGAGYRFVATPPDVAGT